MKKHIICIATAKGGVAKSTTAEALAELAALDGRRVLCIDLDPQGTLTLWADATGATQTAYNIFSGGTLSEAIRPAPGGYDIIPASGNLIAAERMNPAGKGAGIGQTLKTALDPIKKNYDAIFVDCPPTMGNLQSNGIFAANEIICPLEADIAGIRGLITTIDIVSQAKAINRNLRIIGALLCRYDNRPTINRELRDMIKDEAAAAKIPYLGEIRKTVKIPEAEALREPIYRHAPKCSAALDYMRVYHDIFD